jgi:DNA integrity scanning protein DisA with diadenylate cyclase activity
MQSSVWVHLADVVLCTVVLRVIFGWLYSYPRILRLVLTLLAMAVVALVVDRLDLPFARWVVLSLIPPAGFVLLLSCVAEFSRIYQAAVSGKILQLRHINPSHVLPELSEALRQMAKTRTGALLVFPQNDPLEDYVSGGEPVDARVSASLLLSIFNTGSPRHDGAVVVQGDRLVRLGAVLPLAEAEGKPSHIGTRHLAAMGLTEKCDAHAVVVSEERGVISHAKNGKITSLELAEDNAAGPSHLGRAIGWEVAPGQLWRKKVLSFGLWALALVLSVAGSLWGNRMADWFFSRTHALTAVPGRIVLANVPESLFVSKLETTQCDIFMRIPGGTGLPETASTLTVEVDASEFRPGTISLPLSSQMLRGVPLGWRVERFAPTQIQFTLVAARTMDLPVEVRFKNLPKHLRLVKVTPNRAVIQAVVHDATRGAKEPVWTEMVDLGDITEPGQYTRTVPLDLPPSIRPKRTADNEAIVTFQVEGGPPP